jgi:ketosteroid isomerase-like protein
MRSGMKADEAFNKNDAGAVAALFTEDAVLVASDGTDYRCFTKDCFQDKRAVRYAT